MKHSNRRDPSLTMSRTEAFIAQLLLKHGETYGWDLINLAGNEEDALKLRKATIYTHLSRMVDKGFLKCRLEDDSVIRKGQKRRYYQLTGFGQKTLEAYELMMTNMELST